MLHFYNTIEEEVKTVPTSGEATEKCCDRRSTLMKRLEEEPAFV
jgi:hypothetical protein